MYTFNTIYSVKYYTQGTYNLIMKMALHFSFLYFSILYHPKQNIEN